MKSAIFWRYNRQYDLIGNIISDVIGNIISDVIGNIISDVIGVIISDVIGTIISYVRRDSGYSLLLLRNQKIALDVR